MLESTGVKQTGVDRYSPQTPSETFLSRFGSEIDQMLSLARHGKLEEIVRAAAI
jgi:hypothetical protein